jgi:hypothetical protein
MKRWTWIFALLCLSLLLSGCQTEGLYQVTLITEGEHTLSGSQAGDLLVLEGDVHLDSDGTWDGTIYLLAGTLEVGGVVTGDVFAFGGEIHLGEEARIRGNFNYGGGNLTGETSPVVQGTVHTGTGVQVPEVLPEQDRGAGETILSWLVTGLLVGGLALLGERFMPHSLARVREAARKHGVVSGAMGILVGIVGVSLIVTLAYTILLIPVALLGVLILILAIIYGWIAVGSWLGRYVRRRTGVSIPAWLAVFLGTFGFMVFQNLLALLPFVGGLLGILIALVGLGAVFITRFGLRDFVPQELP